MLVDTFASSNDSFLHSQVSTDSISLQVIHCYVTKPSSFIFINTNVLSIVIPLPIVIFILYHGAKQWRNTSAAAAAAVSHSDMFTYHMAIIELFGVLGYALLLSVTNKEDSNRLFVGNLVSEFHWDGQTFFHVLTCLERYLAVIHPITYLKLRNERGIKIRNIIIGCVWLLLFVKAGLQETDAFTTVDFCFYIFPLLVIFLCTISVLCVLIRPGPGDQAGVREKIDQSKQRAFYTIVAIFGTLMLRFMGSLVWQLVGISVISNGCLWMASVSWTGLPSSLVLPLLFLNREQKLVCCKTMADQQEKARVFLDRVNSRD